MLGFVVVVIAAAGGLAGGLGAAAGGGPALGAGVGLAVGFVGAALVYWRLSARLVRMGQVARLVESLASGRLDPGRVDLRVDDDITRMARDLMRLMGQLQGIRQHLDLAATGDLSRTTVAEGELAIALAKMVAEQRSMLERIGRTSASVDRSSAKILGTSREQQANATQQAAVVEQILRTMQSVADNASSVASRAEEVLELAERTDGNNREITQRIDGLAQHAARIGQVLEVISTIAHKSEILALNAALEGTRAGEAGRGFSLVAGQMGQLSESVLAAVVDIQQLTRDIAEATQGTVTAAEQAASGSAATATAAREIRTAVQRQTLGTQQVGRGLEEISSALQEASVGARVSADEASDLAEQSARLQELLTKFKV